MATSGKPLHVPVNWDMSVDMLRRSSIDSDLNDRIELKLPLGSKSKKLDFKKKLHQEVGDSCREGGGHGGK